MALVEDFLIIQWGCSSFFKTRETFENVGFLMMKKLDRFFYYYQEEKWESQLRTCRVGTGKILNKASVMQSHFLFPGCFSSFLKRRVSYDGNFNFWLLSSGKITWKRVVPAHVKMTQLLFFLPLRCRLITAVVGVKISSSFHSQFRRLVPLTKADTTRFLFFLRVSNR